jgi:hypothetical protein
MASEEIRRMRQKGGTTAAWNTTDPTLALFEIGMEQVGDAWLGKIGNGIDKWSDVPYQQGLGDIAYVNTQSGLAYELVRIDQTASVDMTNAAANVLTIPLHATVPFPTASVPLVTQLGAGVTTITATAGVLLNGVDGGSLPIAHQYGVVALRKVATNSWLAFGDI